MASLFIVATPIGNLADLSARAQSTLRQVHIVLCEDTRVTKHLLDAYDIATQTISFHQHSGAPKIKHVIELLQAGKDLALVTDAGTPTISDPGGLLVAAVVKELGEQVKIIPIPGPSALIAGLSVAGKSADKFLFLGFPPQKKGRNAYFDQVVAQTVTVVFYESTHRIIKTLEELAKRVPDRSLVVCRELTKLHETIYRGTPQEVTKQLESSSIKGEFVIIL